MARALEGHYQFNLETPALRAARAHLFASAVSRLHDLEMSTKAEVPGSTFTFADIAALDPMAALAS